MNRRIDKIIIHCSATPEYRHVSTEAVRQWHIEKGWSDIGYHYVVELDGYCKKGRDVETTGAHVRGFNKNSIGVCYIGGVDSNLDPKDTRTELQKDGLNILIQHLMAKYPNAELCGHNEFSSKACPSFNVKEEYKDLIG